jgi:hypothetical protein
MEDENQDQENKIIVNFENNTTINDIEDVPPTEEIKIKKKILKKSKVKLENIEETPINNTSEIKIKKTPKKRTQEIKEEIKEEIPESEIKNKKIVKELIKCSNCNKFLTEKSLKYSHNCTIVKVKKGPLRIIKRNDDNNDNDNNTEIPPPPPPPPLVKNCFSTNILNSRMNKIKKDQERNSNLLINAF